MKRSMKLIRQLIEKFPAELNRVAVKWAMKEMVYVEENEVVVDKDFMKIFDFIATSNLESPSDYLVTKDCVEWVQSKADGISYTTQQYAIFQDIGDTNTLRKTGLFIFVLSTFTYAENIPAVDILQRILDEPVRKTRTLKTRFNHLIKRTNNDYLIEVAPVTVSILSLLSNKKMNDIIDDIRNEYF